MRYRWFALILPTTLSVVVAGCRDERPVVDDKVGEYGKSLGKVKEEIAEGDDSTAQDRRVARQRFVASSQVQLGAIATEIEHRGRAKTLSIERTETMRRDYWHLVELRQQVLDSTDDAFSEALSLYEAQVDTIREQMTRLDRGQLP